MSVWSAAVSSEVPLSGAEGVLVSVAISIEPPRLEALLDALAYLDFPVNPQIYHDGGSLGHPAAIVEFPAYDNRLPEVRNLLEACGFHSVTLQTTAMLDSIHGKHAVAAPA